MERRKDDGDMTRVYRRLKGAIGVIQPGEDQQERLDELTMRLAAGEFHVVTDHRIPYGCSSGRRGSTAKPSAAGGTHTVFVADDLTTKRYAGADDSTYEGYRNTLNALVEAGYMVGGHTSDRAVPGYASGCMMTDRLRAIYTIIATRQHVLHDYAEAAGVIIDRETHELIVSNAKARAQFTRGSGLLRVLQDFADAGTAELDYLDGPSREVMAVFNRRFGTTLDNSTLAREFGDDYMAFNLDVWSFELAAQATALDARETRQKIAAMLYYNFAAAMLLCSRKMRVVFLEDDFSVKTA